jgi:hypothetical protein
MILPDFILHSRVNARWDYSGIDSIKDCLDKTHFKNYPHKVEYSYNSRGFRDAEWPNSIDELKNAIWCIGDSFTVGIGSPLEHTWPYLLQQQTGRRCINVSMDGASNEWIARKTQKIIKEINPTDIVIMWSYTHRREKKDNSLSDEARRMYSEMYVDGLEDFVNFKSCIESVNNQYNNIKHTAIPVAFEGSDLNELIKLYNDVKNVTWEFVVTNDDFDNLPSNIVTELINDFKVYDRMLELSEMARIIDYCKSVHDLLEVERLDYARDYHHFDKLTSQWLIEQIC